MPDTARKPTRNCYSVAMLRPHPAFLSVVACLVAASSLTYAQGFGRRYAPQQNMPPPTELVVARWHFGTNGNIGHMGWSHNYPSSDQNFNGFVRDATRIDVDLYSYRIVELGSDEVFDYPFAYVSEPGEMELTEQEVRNLREFVNRGGFILMDDFDGVWQFEQMRSQITRAFPDKYFGPLPLAHGSYRINFDLPDLSRMSPHVPGGEIVYYGLFDDREHLVVAAGHNNDLANFWDWYDEARFPLEPAADAFRLGINFLVWAMTH
jgi:hypothetical protein